MIRCLRESADKKLISEHTYTLQLFIYHWRAHFTCSLQMTDVVTVCATDKILFDSEEEKTSFYRLLHSSRYWVQDIQTSRAKTELNDSTLP